MTHSKKKRRKTKKSFFSLSSQMSWHHVAIVGIVLITKWFIGKLFFENYLYYWFQFQLNLKFTHRGLKWLHSLNHMVLFYNLPKCYIVFRVGYDSDRLNHRFDYKNQNFKVQKLLSFHLITSLVIWGTLMGYN